MKCAVCNLANAYGKSPPSRAAWIEIVKRERYMIDAASPPSRAAWIEMVKKGEKAVSKFVAAFTGGVD